MQVAFWSLVPGQSATTTNLVALGFLTAFEYRIKILATQTHFEGSNLERLVLDLDFLALGQGDLSEVNFDTLGKLLRFGLIEEEEMDNYTIALLAERFELLPGTKNINKRLFGEEFPKELKMISEAARKLYDLIFVDVAPGLNEINNAILNDSEVVVVCLNQNINVLDGYFNAVDDAIKDKAFYIIGRYDKHSRLNIQSIKRRYKIKGNNIAGIPYSSEFLDACNERKVMDFFYMNHLAKKDDINYEFVEGLKQCSKLLLKYMGYDLKVRRFEDE